MNTKMSSIMEKNEATINFLMQKQRESRQSEVKPEVKPDEAQNDSGKPKFTSQLNSEVSNKVLTKVKQPAKELAVSDIFVPVDNWGVTRNNHATQ
jgi:hypothetical protein